MATYAEYLAEAVEKQEQQHGDRCYHVLTHEQRVENFTQVIVDFCKRFNIDLSPKE